MMHWWRHWGTYLGAEIGRSRRVIMTSENNRTWVLIMPPEAEALNTNMHTNECTHSHTHTHIHTHVHTHYTDIQISGCIDIHLHVHNIKSHMFRHTVYVHPRTNT